MASNLLILGERGRNRTFNLLIKSSYSTTQTIDATSPVARLNASFSAPSAGIEPDSEHNSLFLVKPAARSGMSAPGVLRMKRAGDRTSPRPLFFAGLSPEAA